MYTTQSISQCMSVCAPGGAGISRPDGGALSVAETGEPAAGPGAAEQGDEGQAAGVGGTEPRPHQGHHQRPGGKDCQPGGAARSGGQVSGLCGTTTVP